MAAFDSRNGCQSPIESGRNWAREGSSVQPTSPRCLDGGAAQDLGVQLVGAGHDLVLNLVEAHQQRLDVQRQPVLGGLPLEGVRDPLVPVDQGPVAIYGDPFDLAALGEGHDGAGLWQPAPSGLLPTPPAGSAGECQRLLVLEQHGDEIADLGVAGLSGSKRLLGCTV